MGTTSQKLTYLNDTKTQLKDMINYGLDTGEKITSETTFRNYVKSLFDAFIKTMTYPDVLYNNLPKVTGEGTSLSLNDTVYAPMRVELSPSALEQETTTGKNLLGLLDGTYSDNGITATISNGKITLNGTATATSFIMLTLLKNIVLTNQTITISTNNSIAGGDSSTEIRVYTSGSSFLPCQFNTINNSITYTNKTETYTRFQIRTSSGVTYNNFVLYPQLEEGSSATSYEEYTGGQPSPNPEFPQQIHTVSGENTITISNSDNTQSQTYPLSLGDLEYCKIGDYEDVFFKNVVGSTYYDSTLESGKWYLKKNIGKVVLDGSELDWFNDGGGAPYAIHISNILLDNTKVVVMSDYFIGVSYNSSWTTYDALVSTSIQTAVNPAIKFRYTGNTGGVEGFKTWLSTHNTSVYYILETPAYTLLSDTLQTQLDNLSKAISYQDQTNVSQTNNDLPFVIKLSAIEDLG